MGRKKKNEPDINYLDLIPQRSDDLGTYLDRNGILVLKVENTGWFNTIAQKVFNKPRYTHVHMDKMGTFIWPLIDGERTIHDIAMLVKEEYGEAAEPLYPRIIQYFKIVESYHFIRFLSMPKKK